MPHSGAAYSTVKILITYLIRRIRMTGRDLIIYILENELEDKPVVLDGGFLDLLTVE